VKSDQTVSIIMPAFNEEAAIAQVISKLKELKIVGEIIVVDDCSKDKTAEVAEKAGAKVVRHPYNKGNGAAVKTGIRTAKGDIIVMMDSDGQHDPADVPRLLTPIGEYDMVVGARLKNEKGSTHRNFANRVYNRLATYLCGIKIMDLTSGFRAIKRDIAKKFLYLLPNKFSYPTTITMALIRAGHNVRYEPVTMHQRIGKSKINIFKDGFRFFLIMFRVISLFKPIKVFLPASILFILLGLGNYVHTYIRFQHFTNMSALLIIAGINTFLLGLIAEQISQLRYDRSED
jgi:glycosyltransferase involved in cell wall biosynthesis